MKAEEKSLVDFAFAHDTTRVLQSCLQHGTKEQRRAIFEQLKPRVPEMAKEKYAKNIIWKLITQLRLKIKNAQKEQETLMILMLKSVEVTSKEKVYAFFHFTGMEN